MTTSRPRDLFEVLDQRWHKRIDPEVMQEVSADSEVGQEITRLCAAADALIALCGEADVQGKIVRAVAAQVEVLYFG